ncbi:MAG: hypothetical protein ACK4F9_04510 [Brevinematia bacterium]
MYIRLSLVLLLVSFVLVSCRDETNINIYNLEGGEVLLAQSSKVRYVNGKLNYCLTILSNGLTVLVVNSNVYNLGNVSLYNVIFSDDPNNYSIVISSNGLKYIIYRDKVYGGYLRINEIFFQNGSIRILGKRDWDSNVSYGKLSITIHQKDRFRYVTLPSGKEFGPFVDVQIPSQTIDGKNWWTVAKNIYSNYTLIINGEFVIDNLQDVGIPSFYGTNFVVGIKRDGESLVVVNGKVIKFQSEEIEQPVFYQSTWMVITRSNNICSLVRGEINKNIKRIIYSTTNRIFYPLIDSDGNAWIIEEGDGVSYLIKNYRKVVGVYEKIYYSQNVHRDIVFVCKTNRYWFVVKDNRVYGPFDSVGEILFDEGRLVFSFLSNNQNYIFLNRTNLGPYEKIISLSFEGSVPVVVYQKGGKDYVKISNLYDLGPYDRVFWNSLSYKNGRFLFTFVEGDSVYINYSSRIYGPYKNVYMPILSEDGNVWGAGVMLNDGTFSLMFNGEVVGKYIGVDYESIKFDATNGLWGGITQKTNGFYLTTIFFEKGPFEKILQLKFSRDLMKSKFSVKDNGSMYVYFTDKGKVIKKFGPYKMAIFISENFDSDLMLVLDKNNKYFIYNDRYVFGPYDYIKDIQEKNSKFYFVYGVNGKEGININGKDVLRFSKVIRYSDLLVDDWYVVLYHKGNFFLYTSSNTNLIPIFLNKELLNVNRSFSFVLKNNEWQSLVIDGVEIGSFNVIDKESLIYDYHTRSFVFAAMKNRNGFLVSNAKVFGPYDVIVKFFLIDRSVMYVVEDLGERYFVVDGKKVMNNVLDFDVDYGKKYVSLLILEGSRVIVKTVKVADLLLHRN